MLRGKHRRVIVLLLLPHPNNPLVWLYHVITKWEAYRNKYLETPKDPSISHARETSCTQTQNEDANFKSICGYVKEAAFRGECWIQNDCHLPGASKTKREALQIRMSWRVRNKCLTLPVPWEVGGQRHVPIPPNVSRSLLLEQRLGFDSPYWVWGERRKTSGETSVGPGEAWEVKVASAVSDLSVALGHSCAQAFWKPRLDPGSYLGAEIAISQESRYLHRETSTYRPDNRSPWPTFNSS